MTEASSHHKQMEDLMGSEVFMLLIKGTQLQCIDNSTDRVQNSSRKKPVKAWPRKIMQQGWKCSDAGPAHPDIKEGGKPSGAADPEQLDHDTGDGDAPHKDAQIPAGRLAEGQDGNRGGGCPGRRKMALWSNLWRIRFFFSPRSRV